MCRKLFFPIYLVLVWSLATPASAATLLASYEPSEVNCLSVTSPDDGVSVTWPVEGGLNDVPSATEGNYVLRLDWTGETDRKIEIKHEWADCFTFNLAGYDYILADVYFATESALPEITGIWDDVFGWVSAVCRPCTTGEWHTVLFYVGNLEHTCLDHIFAFLFEKLAGDDGKIYIDNLRLGALEDVLRRQLSFAGYNWLVKDSGCGTHGPGPNYFSHSKENVWVDENGYLHLKIARRCDKWFCSEVILDASPGYGTYVFTTEGRVDLLDPNIVLGLFTWDTDAPHHHYREIDIELSRWWDPNEPNNAQFVVQPWDNPGNRHRFPIDCSINDITTHEISWRPDQIDFRSYYGDYFLAPLPADIIESWSYTGDDIPPAGGENARINFWLLPPKDAPWGTPSPTDGQDAEIVIKSFQYLRNIEADIDIRPDKLNLRSKGKWIRCYIWLPEGFDVADTKSILLNGEVTLGWYRVHENKQMLMAKFNRSEVQDILEVGEVELTVTGQLTDGTRFEGTDTIKVIDKGKKK